MTAAVSEARTTWTVKTAAITKAIPNTCSALSDWPSKTKPRMAAYTGSRFIVNAVRNGPSFDMAMKIAMIAKA